MTVLSVIGTRPEAIKMAPVLAELARVPHRARSIVCVTSQHREMLDQVLRVFAIRPDRDLDVMVSDQSLAQLTAALFARLDPVVAEAAPDWVLAQGDTTTVMVTALVAFYRRIRFGHVEAGLRTGDLGQPFPEEMNRRVADGVASLLFAPTEANRRALVKEGLDSARIIVTGNTVIDALLTIASRPYEWSSGPLASVPAGRRLVVVTAHRRESFGAPLAEICRALRDIARAFAAEGLHVVYPVHLMIEPLDYVSMVHLMKRATLILTDSGGIQEEAPSLRVPVLVLREVTERPEAAAVGAIRVVGTAYARIMAEVRSVLENPGAWTVTGPNPYGDGHAAERVVAALLSDAAR
ncbi:MAG: UDP-N-acetylglucosamine 2-epimerase (non-hydrolyzing) [Candidatus Rokuibacteriota bacterium]|nr:MAG: UDP-N-acetylglucosamine 2-epimerase (non-hydrolyzing) [Candidatus Rokubacteria bacterium]